MIDGAATGAEAVKPSVPAGMEIVRVTPAMVRLYDLLRIGGVWHPVIDMRSGPSGRVLLFKDHPPKVVTAPLRVFRKIAYSRP